MYIYGGCGIEKGQLATLWSLDLTKVYDLDKLSPEEEFRRGAQVEWKRLDTFGSPHKPGSIAHQSSVVCGDKMFMFGGSGQKALW